MYVYTLIYRKKTEHKRLFFVEIKQIMGTRTANSPGESIVTALLCCNCFIYLFYCLSALFSALFGIYLHIIFGRRIVDGLIRVGYHTVHDGAYNTQQMGEYAPPHLPKK